MLSKKILVLFYDITKEDSYEQLERTYREFQQNSSKHFIKPLKMLVGCKEDLKRANDNEKMINKFAKANGFRPFITSARYNKNVDEVFNFIIESYENGFFV